jgi:hypothetical protein
VTAVKIFGQNNDRILRGEWEDWAWGDGWHRSVVYYWDHTTQTWIPPLDASWPVLCLGFQRTVPNKDYSTSPSCLMQEWNVTQSGWPLYRWYYVGIASWDNPEQLITPMQWAAPVWID